MHTPVFRKKVSYVFSIDIQITIIKPIQEDFGNPLIFFLILITHLIIKLYKYL